MSTLMYPQDYRRRMPAKQPLFPLRDNIAVFINPILNRTIHVSIGAQKLYNGIEYAHRMDVRSCTARKSPNADNGYSFISSTLRIEFAASISQILVQIAVWLFLLACWRHTQMLSIFENMIR